MKQEKLEDAAEIYVQQNASGHFVEQKSKAFIAGAKWQEKRMYSGEEVNHYVDDVMGGCNLKVKEWKHKQ
jgi:hypothetical protein